KGDRVWCVLVIDGSSDNDPADCVAVRDVENVSLLVNSSETVSVRGVNVIMGVNVWVSVRVIWFVASDAEMVSVWTQPTLTVGTRAGRQNPSGSPIPIPEHTQSHAPVIDELSGKKHAIGCCKHVEQTSAF
ncbi:DGF-1-like protein, putative, partial [Bodo saltans]